MEINRLNLGKEFLQKAWLIFIATFIHNIEEFVFMDKFLTDHQFGFITIQEFLTAQIIVTIFLFLLIILANQNRHKQFFIRLVLYSAVGLIFNAFTHFAQAIFFQSYVPGLITAFLVLIPTSIFILKTAYGKIPSRLEFLQLWIRGIVVIILTLLIAIPTALIIS